MGNAHQLDVRVDGSLVKRFTVGGEAQGRPAPVTFTIAEPGDPAWEDYLHTADDQLEARIAVTAGPRVVGVSFVRNVWEPEGILKPRQAGELLSTDEVYHGNAAVSSVSIAGPYESKGVDEAPNRRALFVCSPASSVREDERRCATEILTRVARRAYRRPVTPADRDTLLSFFDRGRNTALEIKLNVGWRVWRSGHRLRQRKDILRWFCPRILKYPALDRLPPKI